MSTRAHRAAALLILLSPFDAVLAADQVAPVTNTLRSAAPPVAATPVNAGAAVATSKESVAATAKPAAYVPKTAYDNSPYRFNAGKRFTAAEFDAWMQSRGIRVAKGKPAAGPDAAVDTDAAAVTNASDASACNAQSVSAC